MHDVRSNLCQRRQHKAAMLHCGMRDAELLRIQNFVAKKNNIHIDGSWPLWFSPLSSHGLLNREHTLQKLQRRQFGLHGYSTVQEPGLLAGHFYRLCLIKVRNPGNRPQFPQPGDRFAKILFPITQIRSQREVNQSFS